MGTSLHSSPWSARSTFCTPLNSGGFRWIVSTPIESCKSTPGKHSVLFSDTRKTPVVNLPHSGRYRDRKTAQNLNEIFYYNLHTRQFGHQRSWVDFPMIGGKRAAREVARLGLVLILSVWSALFAEWGLSTTTRRLHQKSWFLFDLQ